MAFVAAKGSVVVGDAVGLTGYLNQYSSGRSQQAINTTTFGNDDEAYTPGLLSASLTVGGLFDGDAGASDATFSTMVDSQSTNLVTVGHGGDAIGDGAYLFNGVCTNYGITGAHNDAVRLNVGFEGSAAVRNGVMLHAVGAETGTGNYASVDQTASSTFGGVANLHVTAFTGTNVTIKIQDSANDSTWADLITFSSVTGTTQERATVTGSVDRYVRAIISAGTFTSVTFAVAFARNRQ
jgi:hypothetical protein